jgi:hypothetical protein
MDDQLLEARRVAGQGRMLAECYMDITNGDSIGAMSVPPVVEDFLMQDVDGVADSGTDMDGVMSGYFRGDKLDLIEYEEDELEVLSYVWVLWPCKCVDYAAVCPLYTCTCNGLIPILRYRTLNIIFHLLPTCFPI